MNVQTYLINCISNNTGIIKEQYDFEYAGICGYSELIGWKIISVSYTHLTLPTTPYV